VFAENACGGVVDWRCCYNGRSPMNASLATGPAAADRVL
jgi:hypothetical protein